MPSGSDRPRRGRRAEPRGGADIRAVAKRADVSASTVSRFLNGKKRLSSDTEKRIQDAVHALGYAPNRVARSLRLKRTNTVGLLLPDSSNPYFSELVRGAEDACRNGGFALVLFNSGEDRAREAAHLQTLQDLRCDGALIIVAPDGPQEQERRERLERFPLPTVYVDRLPGVPADSVVADNFNGGYEATRYLIRLGHRRIALLSVDYDVSSHRDRRAGYVAALKEAKIDRRPELEARVSLTVQDGFSAASGLLSLAERPTAFFVTSNALTIGTVSAIQARGLRCPQDASVIGYDSYDWQEVFAPRLSTIKQPAYLLGQRAAELLLDRISAKRTGAHEKVVLRTTLVVRDSCEAWRDGGAGVRSEPSAAGARSGDRP